MHFHDLRHTGNMLAAESGAGLKDLMARMGHDNVRAAMIYQHAVRGADKSITDAIDKHITGEGEEDDDGPAGVLVPVGQLHVNCTEDRLGPRNNQGPGWESSPDAAWVLTWRNVDLRRSAPSIRASRESPLITLLTGTERARNGHVAVAAEKNAAPCGAAQLAVTNFVYLHGSYHRRG
ncbi:site-specific integrase [Sphaerisporangium sp. NPDC088356]|uniref:site-specific integrase n=1 Tax=Sphaerisporangium sp. NPDC088356 TaxID=3154871 RepID=UPI00343585B8